MNDIIKWCLKTLFQGVIWVFILSITIGGRPLFDHAHSTFVDNALVKTVDEELADLFTKLSRTAEVTFSEKTQDSEESM